MADLTARREQEHIFLSTEPRKDNFKKSLPGEPSGGEYQPRRRMEDKVKKKEKLREAFLLKAFLFSPSRERGSCVFKAQLRGRRGGKPAS